MRSSELRKIFATFEIRELGFGARSACPIALVSVASLKERLLGKVESSRIKWV